jgi:hypothetical protein
VERQHAWALGARASRRIVPGEGLTLSPFFGPAWARVRAIEEETDHAVNIGHLMWLGGSELDAGRWNITLLGTHSTYTRDPSRPETHWIWRK